MITISNDLKTAALSDGAVIYTEDGKTFTQVELGQVVSITQPGSLIDAFRSVVTVGPVPDSVAPMPYTPLSRGQ